MPYQEFDRKVPYGRRLNRHPTNEITELARRFPQLYDADVGEWQACSTAPDNFLGTLVIALHKNTFSRMYGDAGFALADRIQVPFEVVENVPLLDHKGKPIGSVAQRVFAKHAVGNQTAVVIKGPYSGIILQKQHHRKWAEGMHIARIWNNLPFSQTYPDNPKFNSGPITLDPLFVSWYVQNHGKLISVFEDLYRKIKFDLREIGEKDISSITAFYRLLQHLNITMDIDQFHATLSSN